MRQLFIGLVAEGTTDVRFLKNVINRSVLELSWQCDNQVEIYDVREIKVKGDSFTEKMLAASRRACKEGLDALCIHVDADARSAEMVMQHKFAPFFDALNAMAKEECCKHIVPTVPIQMIESWMLADKELLKRLINAEGKSDVDLGIEKAPEAYSDPKSTIENAIRTATAGQSKKRRMQITISDLYELLGNSLQLEKLRTIPSFQGFERNVLRVFAEMGLMRG